VGSPRMRKKHFVDHGERDAEGYYDFYYAYWEYEIEFGDRRHGVRVYDDQNDVAFVNNAPAPTVRTGTWRNSRRSRHLATRRGQGDPHARRKRRLRASGVAGPTP
jgi:hypothetical protein